MNGRRNQRRGGRTAGSGSATPDSVGLRTPAGSGDGGTGRQVLFYTNAPWTKTGYGQQAAQLTKRLIKAGHQTAIHANYGLEGANTVWQGIEIYPKGMSAYSDDVTVAHYQEWAHRAPERKPLLLTLFDVWVFQSKAFDLVPSIVSWVPVDHTPCPPDVVAWCKRENVTTVAMSKFGQTMLHNAGVDALYAPHGIEKDFAPTETFGGISGRKLAGVPEDAFMVMINAANKGNNPPRKAWGENFLAFAMFAKTHPDAYLYVHSDIQGSQGVNLRSLADACGIPNDRLVFADQYVMRSGLEQKALAALYSSADVLLACSMGEGFGIPVVEAQACGTPVITTNQTAQKELNGSGWLVDCQPFWDHAQRSWFHMPYIREIVAGLEMAYEASISHFEAAIAFARDYDADHVFNNYWKPVMAVAP